MTQQSTRGGLLSVHAAALLFGGTGLFSRIIDLSALDMTAMRSGIAAVVLLGVLVMTRRSLKLNSFKDTVFMAMGGVCLGLHWVTYFHAMQVSSIAIGMIALFTYPMITIFLEPFVTRSRPSASDVICGLAVLCGVVLMVPTFSLDSTVTQGVMWGVLSALLFSVRNILQRHALSVYGGEVSIFYQGSVVLLMTLLFVEHIPPLSDTMTWAQLLVLGAMFTALPHTLFAKGLQTLKAKTVSLVACLQPVYGTLFAFVLLNEQPELMTLVGGVIIVSAATWETYRS
ncbi:MAG: DMT family transporter [Pseudomonadota bacterium]